MKKVLLLHYNTDQSLILHHELLQLAITVQLQPVTADLVILLKISDNMKPHLILIDYYLKNEFADAAFRKFSQRKVMRIVLFETQQGIVKMYTAEATEYSKRVFTSISDFIGHIVEVLQDCE